MLGLDHVRINEPSDAGVLVKRDPGPLEILAQQRLRADVTGDLADAIEQPRVVERGFAGGDAVARELPGFPDQARGVRQRADVVVLDRIRLFRSGWSRPAGARRWGACRSPDRRV